jgi:hypothetical protein
MAVTRITREALDSLLKWRNKRKCDICVKILFQQLSPLSQFEKTTMWIYLKRRI